ncbi:hypothetical protein XELAEV_18002797mg [Xenopus laevis]|nr:hypothetical protein XELAEV_18002797mg [Xenopus laevis]
MQPPTIAEPYFPRASNGSSIAVFPFQNWQSAWAYVMQHLVTRNSLNGPIYNKQNKEWDVWVTLILNWLHLNDTSPAE